MPKILVIDDENDFALMLKARLETKGFEVSMAGNGVDGLKKAIDERPDLIIVDNLMPKMSGYEMVNQLRADFSSDLAQIPVIVMSCKKSMRQLFEHHSISAFLYKPFEPEDLIGKVNAALNLEDIPVEDLLAVNGNGENGNKHVVLSGMEEFILNKVKDYLESLGFQVVRAYDEADTVEKASQMRPRFVLSQFWEEPEKFNAGRIYSEIQSHPKARSVNCAVFCTDSVGFDAAKAIPRDNLITYSKSSDLTDKIGEFIKLNSPG